MVGFFEWMVESSLLVVMVLGIRKFFMGRIRYAAIYALWLIVLLRFIIPVNFIPAPINIGNVFSKAILSGISVDSGNYDVDAAGFVERGDIYEESTGRESDAYPSGIISKKRSTSTVEYAALGSSRGRTTGLVVICAGVIISALLFVWIVMSNMNIIRKIKRRRVWYGRRKDINIYTVDCIDNPCLYGFFRPAIYIPEALVPYGREGKREVSEDELEQIITHEYVHYLHKDHIWAAFRVILLSVYWFHPFVWAAVFCSKKDAELFCDETVVENIGDEKRICYGEMLIRLAQDAGWGDFRYSMTPMSRRGKELGHRIIAISRKKSYSGWLVVPLVFAAALALGVTCGTGAMKIKGSEIQNDGDMPQSTGKPQVIIYNNGMNTGSPQVYNTGMDYNDADEQMESGIIKPWTYEDNSTLDTAVVSADYEQAFSNYIDIFTDAVNTGNTDRLHYVLQIGSEVYGQQCKIAMNYHNRGIREEVKSYVIGSVSEIDTNQVVINSKEKIRVYYADGTSKLVKQEYSYVCENIDGSWIITKMSDIDSDY